MSSAWVPRSSTAPPRMHTTSSAFLIVLSRCAMTTVVRPAMRPSSARCTSSSFSASSAEVASSSTSTGASLSSARAMATRCRWPPDSCTPPSPTLVA
mmetsp:Transcript_7411/g.13732  ORF Transcript_7411/g.13732 Transcript_7411/m.13732 type:complete len:97 (-) Transcript_7411:109-399(-)